MEIEHVVFPFTIPGVSIKWADNTLRSGKTNPLRNVLFDFLSTFSFKKRNRS